MTGIGGDERRVRQLLRARGVGYAPQAPPPAAGWWDALYDDDHQDHHRPETPPPAAPRLPDWRKRETADLGGDRPDAEPEPPEKPTAAPAVDDEEHEGEEREEWEDVDEPEPQPAPTRTHPRRAPAGQRAQQAYAELPTRARAALYTGTAAGAGYWIGLAPLMQGWIAGCGRDNGPTAGVILGVGLILACGVLIDRRTRGWWGPLPWLCRIPLASALLALLLYAPGAAS